MIWYSTMRHDALLFALLGTLFFFCSLYLLAALGTLYNPDPEIRLIVTGLHFAAALVGGLLLRPFYRHNSAGTKTGGALEAAGNLFPLPALLALACLAAVFCLPDRLALSAWATAPAAVLLGFLCPLILCCFFSTARPGKQGLPLALCISGGKFLWIALLPLINFSGLPALDGTPDLLEPAAAASSTGTRVEMFQYLYKMLGVTIFGLGVCTSLFLRRIKQAARTEAQTGIHLRPLARPPAQTQARRRAMACFFAAGAIFMLLLGLEGGLFLFRLVQHPTGLSGPHWLLLLFLPVVGGLLDCEGGGRVDRLRWLGVIALLAVALALCLAVLYGQGQSNGPRGWLSSICSGVQLVLFVLTARLMAQSRNFSLLLVAVYALVLMTIPGALAGNGPDWQAAGLGVLLFLGLAFCIRRGLVNFKAIPDLPGPAAPPLPDLPDSATLATPDSPSSLGGPSRSNGQPRPDEIKEPNLPPRLEAGEDAARLLAFSAAFSLTRRETEILAHLIRNLSLEGIAETLGVCVSTIRFHQTGLLKKTGQPSRRKLHDFYRAWVKH